MKHCPACGLKILFKNQLSRSGVCVKCHAVQHPQETAKLTRVSASKEVRASLTSHTLYEIERSAVLLTLEKYHGNRTRAADFLGICLRTLRMKLNQYRRDGYYVIDTWQVVEGIKRHT